MTIGVRVSSSLSRRTWNHGGRLRPEPRASGFSSMVKPGESVKKGAKLLSLEAMKMQVNVTAPKDGIVRDVPVKKGDIVEAGDLLVVFE